MAIPSPAEWGRAQAKKAPEWTEERWARVARILGVEMAPNRRNEGRARRSTATQVRADPD